jgi:predicted acyl esterase
VQCATIEQDNTTLADSEIRDGMRIDWDAPIVMDDGLTLRADVFRPVDDAPHPVILSYGPYAKGLAFQEGYPSAWQRMVSEHPDVAYGSSNKYQNWEVVDPEKWVPSGYVCVRVDSRGTGRSPGYVDPFSPRETRDLYECTTASTSGMLPRCSRRILRRCACGKEPPTGTAT